MLSTDQLLEAITESIRKYRRYGKTKKNEPKFPTILDLSFIKWDTEAKTIELNIVDETTIRRFELVLRERTENAS